MGTHRALHKLTGRTPFQQRDWAFDRYDTFWHCRGIHAGESQTKHGICNSGANVDGENTGLQVELEEAKMWRATEQSITFGCN